MGLISELKSKEIINVNDGIRLGFVSDIEINLTDGKIESLIVATSFKFFGILRRQTDVVVPWKCVEKIGNDLIIVRI